MWILLDGRLICSRVVLLDARTLLGGGAAVVTSPVVLVGDVAVGMVLPTVAGAASPADPAGVVTVDVASLADAGMVTIGVTDLADAGAASLADAGKAFPADLAQGPIRDLLVWTNLSSCECCD